MAPDHEGLRAFVDLTSSLLETSDLRDSLQLIVDEALRLTAAEHCSIRVLDGSGTKVLSGAGAGTEADDELMEAEASRDSHEWVIEHKEPLLVADAAKDERFEGPVDDGKGSILAVPLLFRGEVLGVLTLASDETEAFGEDDEATATLVANCASPVVERTRLERLAMTDEQTLAYNDHYLLPRLKEEISRSQRYGHPLSVLLLKLDQFAKVRKVHGGEASDVVLQRFADRIRASVRLSDVLVRRDDDEFAIIATNTPYGASAAVAERVRKRLADAPLLKDQHGTAIEQTVSIGIAGWTGDESPESLVTRAKISVERSVLLGGNKVVALEPGDIAQEEDDEGSSDDGKS